MGDLIYTEPHVTGMAAHKGMLSSFILLNAHTHTDFRSLRTHKLCGVKGEFEVDRRAKVSTAFFLHIGHSHMAW